MGDPLDATLVNQAQTYALTPPSTGTLVLKLSWDASNGARLKLTVANTLFEASAPNWSPIIGRIAVSKGQPYQVTIDAETSPWDYGYEAHFVLTTAIE